MELSNDMEGENENYICTLLDEDGWECGQRWPTARALAAHQRRTQGRTHGEPKGVASLVVTHQCFWCGSTHVSIETTSKHMAAAERHNRCVVDAGRLHYLIIDILPDTICPRCDLIFNDTAEFLSHLASTEFPPPKGHALVINAEASDSASGGNLWQQIRDRWRVRREEWETKTQRTAAWRVEGRRDDGRHELGVERERQGQTHRHEAAQRRPQDSLRFITTSSASQRRNFHVLDDQARGARVQETEGAIARFFGAGDIKGKGDTDSDHQGLQRLRGSYKHCRREAARWERPTRQGWQT